ncbi:MAG: hypothetical protein GXO45_01885 [Aquificae bacterium]|nr:hypothetical protein [Aquificota bacterium]
MLKKVFLSVWFFVFTAFFLSCDGSGGSGSGGTSALLDAQLVAKLSSDDVNKMLSSSSSSLVAGLSPVSSGVAGVLPTQPFGILIFKVLYLTTDEEGNTVEASGIVAFPDPETLPSGFTPAVVSDQHGTIFTDKEAPSNVVVEDIKKLISGQTDVSATFKLIVYYTGKLGFTVSMPDYIGYGASVDHYHTYMMENPLANSSIDLLKAVVELAQTSKIPIRKEVYLAGYSEGGYATMATAKKLQEDSQGFTVKGVFPMAGVYDLETLGMGIISSPTMVFPPYPAYVVYAYSKAYPDVNLSEVFNPPFDTQMDSLFDKTKDGFTILGMMFAMVGKDPTKGDVFTPSDLFTAEAIDGFLNNTEYPLRARLRENNVDDWIPMFPMFIVHCGGDNILPQDLAYATFQKFSDGGAPFIEFIDPEDVFGLEATDHSKCATYSYQILFGTLCQLEYGVSCN